MNNYRNLLLTSLTGLAALGFYACGAGETGPQGEKGEPGQPGASCTLTANEDGSATISCPDGNSFTIKNGENGLPGDAGSDGKNVMMAEDADKDEGGVVRPMLSGLLCFGDFVTISNELPDYFLDYREKTGDGTRWKDRVAAHDATWSGNIIDFYFRIYDRLTSDVKVPFKLDARSQRVNETKVHDVLREVLANALIHADYHGRRGIVIEKQFDTIVFRNPGDLRLAKEIAIEGGTTDARNSKIFNIFALIDVGERSGMGLSNLYSTWAELGYDRPDLEEFHEPDQTVLKVYLKTSTKSVKTSTKKTSSKSEKTREKKTRGKKLTGAAEPLENKGETPKTVGKKTVGKGEKTRGKKARGKSLETRGKDLGLKDEDMVVLRLTSSRVVEVMRRNPKVTREELADQLRVTLKGIEWQVAKLQKDKVIRRVGGRKFGSWEVLI